MKLCKDCKYFSAHPSGEPICMHNQAQTNDDPIWGNHSRRTCKEMRSNRMEFCGKLGTLWIASANFTPMEYTNENA